MILYPCDMVYPSGVSYPSGTEYTLLRWSTLHIDIVPLWDNLLSGLVYPSVVWYSSDIVLHNGMMYLSKKTDIPYY